MAYLDLSDLRCVLCVQYNFLDLLLSRLGIALGRFGLLSRLGVSLGRLGSILSGLRCVFCWLCLLSRLLSLLRRLCVLGLGLLLLLLLGGLLLSWLGLLCRLLRLKENEAFFF